ncbi:MAG: hypothetical protein BWX80_00181 [Candidatus Hydrogenedentes bacterium ADurb.Bin101]|nr:MAG: hypothetical protein BWX80_00181 [Candidatus Hydrogenedentes bacterium ADurb.Bin101]
MLALSISCWFATKSILLILHFTGNAKAKVKAQVWLAHSKIFKILSCE